MERNQLLAIVVVVVIVGAAGAYILLQPTPPTEQTIVWETIGNPNYMDPHVNYESFGSWIHYNVYETLYTYEWDSMATEPTQPLLATDLTISGDGKTYTFELREGVTFHDGTPFNASSVKYNFERVLAVFDPGGPAYMISGPIKGGSAIEDAVYGYGAGSDQHVGNYTAWKAANDAGTGAINVVDDYTIEIVLEYPYAPFLPIITYAVGAIISPTFIEANGGIEIGSHNEVLDEETCGTGPYMVTEWEIDDHITLELYDNYWREADARAQFPFAGAAETIIINTVDDVNSRILNIEAGVSDGTYWPTSHADQVYDNESTTPAFENNDGTIQSTNPNLKVWAKYPTYTLASIHFLLSETYEVGGNVLKNPFYLKDLRQAASYAFDYDTYIDNVVNGHGVKGQGPIPIGMFGHDDDAFQYPYDIDTAVDKWNDAMTAGLDDILENCSYTIDLFFNEGNEVRRKGMLLLKDGLHAILNSTAAELPAEDLIINVQGVEWSSYIGRLVAGNMQSFMIGWAPDYADPSNFIAPYVHSTGTFSGFQHISESPGWNATAMDAKIKDAARSTDASERITLYEEIQDAIIVHAAYIWVYQPTVFHVERVEMNGYQFNPMHDVYFYHYWKSA